MRRHGPFNSHDFGCTLSTTEIIAGLHSPSSSFGCRTLSASIPVLGGNRYSRVQDVVGVLGSQGPRLQHAISSLVAATRLSIPLLSIGSIG